MYQALLTRRYLFRKVIPLLAMLSVALCTAMVIIVLSVMSGFLEMVTDAGRKLIGDVAIDGQMTGFPYYDEIIEELGRLETVQTASPMVSTFGLVKLPPDRVATLHIHGIQPESYSQITGFGDALYWRPLTPEEEATAPDIDLRRTRPVPNEDPRSADIRRLLTDSDSAVLQNLLDFGKQLKTGLNGEAGVVLGIRVNVYNKRRRGNIYEVLFGQFLPIEEVTLTVVPLTREGDFRLQAERRGFRVLNEFTVQRSDVDKNYAYVSFDVLQKMLGMQARQEVSETETDEFGDPLPTGRMLPARATSIVIKGKEGVDPIALRDQAAVVYRKVYARHENEDPAFTMPIPDVMMIRTWEQQIAQFIGAVKKERALVTSLFIVISLVAVMLVLSIFWTIVQQKTRDIGILRSVGASRLGITWLFLRYGAALGIIGALLGCGIAHLIVWNINPIHEFIGEVFGMYIWDPDIYYFNELPDHVNPLHALTIMTGGMVFAVFGALIPAWRAAYVDPVAALRYE